MDKLTGISEPTVTLPIGMIINESNLMAVLQKKVEVGAAAADKAFTEDFIMPHLSKASDPQQEDNDYE